MKLTLVAVCCVVVSGCASHAYTSLTAGEQIRDINLRSGSVSTIGGGTGQLIIGLAADPVNNSLYARVAPNGNQLRELDRDSGAIVRQFVAERVVPGCGQQTVTLDAIVCGLAIRLFDHHLFLDHPQGLMIHEVDSDGKWIQNIQLQSPGGAIGGLAYDQRNGVLYALFIRTSEVAEIDMSGVERRRFRFDRSVQPEGLSIGVNSDELYVPLAGGSVLGAFDTNGRFIRQYPLNRSATGPAAGVGADSRRTNRVGP